MNASGQLDWWARAIASVLLIATYSGCAGHGQCHKLPWHHKRAEVVWEFPYYGHYPTCWRRWPADWIVCPPSCPELAGGMAADSQLEIVPVPAGADAQPGLSSPAEGQSPSDLPPAPEPGVEPNGT